MSTQTPESHPYRGRFAPSPTGALHIGSLVTAVGSYLQARVHGGDWLVRIEDLDPPREKPGAADRMLRTLEAFGMLWDGEVRYQSRRSEAYEYALDRLRREGLTYPCACSRREISERQNAGGGPLIYPGTCRRGLPPGRRPRAWRVLTDADPLQFTDRIQGHRVSRLDQECGDFVIRRADGWFAYQLAVVIDDADQGITEIVRGCDLLESTPRQIHLQRLLGLATPDYAHLPLVLDEHGHKLSKQDRAAPVDPRRPGQALYRALAFLGQSPPSGLTGAGVEVLWAWALEHWQLRRVPPVGGRPDQG